MQSPEGRETHLILDHIGRCDSGSFHEDSYSDLAAVKQSERQKVLEFIVPYSTKIGPKILTMPGTSWVFETALIAACPPGTHVVGIESSLSVYYRAKLAMPMLSMASMRDIPPDFLEFTVMSERMRSYGNSAYTYARSTANRNGVRKCRSAHRLVHMKLSTFTSMLVTDYGQTTDQRRDFHQRFYSRTAAWLDFTGSMSKEIENSLRCLPLVMAAPTYSPEPKPVVITLFGGHDRFHGNEERVAHIVQVQPLFKPIKHWTYAGKNGSPMLTICGEIV